MKQREFVFAFAFLLIAGLALSLYELFHVLPLISDAVNPGLYAYSFWHGCPGIAIPGPNSYLIEYLIDLIVVPLSGYTWGLYATSWFFFLGTVVAGALLAWRVSGDGAIGLAAGAAVANVPLMASQYLMYPIWHGSTAFLTVAALLIACTLPDKKDKKRAIWLSLLFLTCFVAVYGDDLAVPLLLLPAMLTLPRPQEPAAFLGGMTALLSKTFLIFLPCISFIRGPAVNPLNFTIAGLADYLLRLVNASNGLVLFLLVVLAVAFIGAGTGGRRRLAAFALLALALVGAGYACMQIDPHDGVERYLAPGLAVATAIGFGSFKMDGNGKIGDLLFIALAALFVLNAFGVLVQPASPNYLDAGVVDALHRENVTFAYARYWVANVISYQSISDGVVAIQPVTLPVMESSIAENETLSIQTDESLVAWRRWPPTGSTAFLVTDMDPIDVWLRAHAPAPTRTVDVPWYASPAMGRMTLHIYMYDDFTYNGTVQ